ncbi:LON peptidase substrate-binding domain-containing protein [Accumulibacter sp.]|uniref:LON peptidase substrate-binding domain-containing protein n=1 Tax=Accumulibacter sp. TaxID=2053492 RepID=UPI0028C3EE7E|nr:LON peptidase substrate-binding domain-containing protein [Accumulibacter sp.]
MIPADIANGRQTLEIPLFPLGAVLFPGGELALKVFEQRYLDMVAACMRNQSAFGVCLIASGHEVGAPAEPYPVGTLAHMVKVDMPQLGIMLLEVRGGHRFRIKTRTVTPGGLLRAEVELFGESERQSLPPALAGLGSLLQRMANDSTREAIAKPHAFDDASWVGYRLSERLPLDAKSRQKLLELDDPAVRLEALASYLSQRRLIL